MIHVRTTAAEAERWRQKARAAGVTVSKLLRQAMRRTWTAPQARAQAELVRQVADVVLPPKSIALEPITDDALFPPRLELDRRRRSGGELWAGRSTERGRLAP